MLEVDSTQSGVDTWEFTYPSRPIKGVKNIKLFQLSVEDVEALVKVYKKDFLMFGYSPQQYKDIALRD